MKKTLYTILALLIISLGVYYFYPKKVVESPHLIITNQLFEDGTYCFSRSQIATKEKPYSVTEDIFLNIAGNKVTGTKTGNQSGPDMTNGYFGNLEGTINEGSLELVYSYTIEDSQNKELELYEIDNTSLFKIRFPLIEKDKMLVPDKNGTSEKITYSKKECEVPKAPETIAMCYHYSENNTSIQTWLKMSLLGDKVTGEYSSINADKNNIIGKFSGTVGKMDPKISARTADVLWNYSMGKIIKKEQLRIQFGEGSAVVLPTDPKVQLSQIDCISLDEKIKLINKNPTEEKPVMCTMDAKQCPDGSYVGRSGPNCEFVCPL